MKATFSKAGAKYELAFERRLAHPVEKVWRVLTERELLNRWFPAEVAGEWKVGARLRFAFPGAEGEALPEGELRGEVLAVDPPHLLEFRWSDSILRWELRADGEGCRLSFTEFLDDPSKGARSAAGWEMCLENLELLAQGGILAKFAWGVWRAKYSRYAKEFEAVHGRQQGPPENFSPAT
ncbi:MAG: SRPBCC family protein [Acidobacteriota bacterium]